LRGTGLVSIPTALPGPLADVDCPDGEHTAIFEPVPLFATVMLDFLAGGEER